MVSAVHQACQRYHKLVGWWWWRSADGLATPVNGLTISIQSSVRPHSALACERR